MSKTIETFFSFLISFGAYVKIQRLWIRVDGAQNIKLNPLFQSPFPFHLHPAHKLYKSEYHDFIHPHIL